LIEQFKHRQLYEITQHTIHISYQSGQHILHKYISHKRRGPLNYPYIGLILAIDSFHQ